jgi:hypothetical protein
MFASEILFYNLMMISGRKVDSGGLGSLTFDSERRVSARGALDDVLLRKRA